MKKTILFLVMLISVSAFAQERQGRRGERTNVSVEERNTAMVNILTEQLELTGTQQEQIKALLNEQTEQRRARMAERRENNDHSSRAEMRKALEARQQEMQEKLKTILTEEQFAKWEKIRSRQQERRIGN